MSSMIACTTVADKDMVNIWALIHIPTASLGVLEPLDLPAVTLSTAGNRKCILGIYAVWPSLRFMSIFEQGARSATQLGRRLNIVDTMIVSWRSPDLPSRKQIAAFLVTSSNTDGSCFTPSRMQWHTLFIEDEAVNTT